MQNKTNSTVRKVVIIDSHTAGEPTRVVIEGGPPLGKGTLAQRREKFQKKFDRFRSAVVNEPRGSDVYVGALLVEPTDQTCATGVIFFNNVGYLGMCGHGTIGVMATLAHLGKIEPGTHRIETPVGIVVATLLEDARVSVENIPSYRAHKDVLINVPDIGQIRGDIAWGGNWFFLCENHGQELGLNNVEHLVDFAWHIRQAVNEQGYPEVDHIELFSPSDSHSFVLCPGKAYDRSPCGTGTSAKLSCLAADGKLKEGEIWTQESIVGSKFEAKFRWEGEKIIPTITGIAFVNARSTLLLNEDDPFCWGIAH